ncbi:hypothetical protein K466DRAFT_603385 [Polyporus arcularius HHB13444]|uniref:DUF6533 domain-containing protein n=1 Tax=Polyporus arcularius HHB13444 TaxID=1314778 RepID=A0A5C3NZV9_9APHY|nr:hypothetical protein K466DRAFT_603385 [Polyporus arcularius HHB13444]
MSYSDYSPADIIAAFQSTFDDDCCWYAGAVFVVYEYVITFGQEVDLFWKRRWTGASLLFFLNRYLALLLILCGMLEYVPKTDSSCAMVVRWQAGVEYTQYLPWAVFSGLRAFALGGQNWFLAGIVLLLSLVPLGINFGQYAFGLTGEVDSLYGCSAVLPITEEFARKYALVLVLSNLVRQLTISLSQKTCLIASDALVIAITWFAMLRCRDRFGEITWNSTSLTTILARDGSIYFVLLLILNTLHLTFTMLSIHAAFEPLSYFSDFTEPATTVLVSRFLLDLQSANQRALKVDSDDPLYLDSMSFSSRVNMSRIVGSLGTSLGQRTNDQR